MRWYVSRNGDTQGPVEESQVVEWVRGGMSDASVRDEAGGNWMPIAQSPFARLLPRRASPVGFLIALVVLSGLIALVVGAGFSALFFVTFGAVGIIAIGGRSWPIAVRVVALLAVALAVTIVWVVGGLLFWSTPKSIAFPMERSEPAGPVYVPPVMPQGPTAADRAQAKVQFEADRDKLRKTKPRPTTEAEVVRVIGRKPDAVMTAGPTTYSHWYYETKELGRDVLGIATSADGKIVVADF